ncbi:hypothetical protein DND62_23895 [Pseudomonas syringae pv. pisi]|jgi:hypothetical protein|nr:hypothetical protein DND62_23895 [Pseudomonas syringae pv. pisi]
MEALIESPDASDDEPWRLGSLAPMAVKLGFGDEGKYRVADIPSMASLIQAEQFHVPEHTPMLR